MSVVERRLPLANNSQLGITRGMMPTASKALKFREEPNTRKFKEHLRGSSMRIHKVPKTIVKDNVMRYQLYRVLICLVLGLHLAPTFVFLFGTWF